MKHLLLMFVFSFAMMQGEVSANSGHGHKGFGVFGWHPGKALSGVLSNVQDRRQARVADRQSRRSTRRHARCGSAPTPAKPEGEKLSCPPCTDSSSTCKEGRSLEIVVGVQQ